jgi:membrane protease YdiL (CAAX protease family)
MRSKQGPVQAEKASRTRRIKVIIYISLSVCWSFIFLLVLGPFPFFSWDRTDFLLVRSLFSVPVIIGFVELRIRQKRSQGLRASSQAWKYRALTALTVYGAFILFSSILSMGTFFESNERLPAALNFKPSVGLPVAALVIAVLAYLFFLLTRFVLRQSWQVVIVCSLACILMSWLFSPSLCFSSNGFANFTSRDCTCTGITIPYQFAGYDTSYLEYCLGWASRINPPITGEVLRP